MVFSVALPVFSLIEGANAFEFKQTWLSDAEIEQQKNDLYAKLENRQVGRISDGTCFQKVAPNLLEDSEYFCEEVEKQLFNDLEDGEAGKTPDGQCWVKEMWSRKTVSRYGNNRFRYQRPSVVKADERSCHWNDGDGLEVQLTGVSNLPQWTKNKKKMAVLVKLQLISLAKVEPNYRQLLQSKERLEGKPQKTSTKKRTLSPVWNETFDMNTKEGRFPAKLKVMIFKDTWGPDNELIHTEYVDIPLLTRYHEETINTDLHFNKKWNYDPTDDQKIGKLELQFMRFES